MVPFLQKYIGCLGPEAFADIDAELPYSPLVLIVLTGYIYSSFIGSCTDQAIRSWFPIMCVMGCIILKSIGCLGANQSCICE